MAGLPWFEADTNFSEHPKVLGLAARLKEPLADAYVARLWAYCYRHAQDRFVGESAASMVEAATRWRGKPGALVEAMVSCGLIDRDGQDLVAHGVAERLGPHLAKRAHDAERQAKRRAKATARIGQHLDSPRDVTRDVPRDITRESLGDTDKDRDKDTTVVQPANHSEQKLAGRLTLDEGLVRVSAKLAAHYGRPNPLGVGKDWKRVEASFGRWLDTVGEDALVAECIRIAKEQNVEPSHLSWWPGWLDTVPETALQRAGGLQ